MANSPITPVKVNYATGDVLTAQNLDDEASAINRLAGYASQATANSTKTLVVTDNKWQEFTGTTAGQIVVMPVVTTLGLGMDWVISNKSTQTIAVQSSGANAIATVAAGTDVRVTCILLTGTTAASWQTSIVGYTTSPAGGVVQLAQSVLGSPAASVSFSSISGSYKNLRVVYQARSSTAATTDTLGFQFNGDTTANYDQTQFSVYQGSSAGGSDSFATTRFGAVSTLIAASAAAGLAGSGNIYIPNYSGTTFNKGVTQIGESKEGTATPNMKLVQLAGQWRNTAAITSISFFPTSGGNFATGSTFTLYGEL